MKGRSRPAPHPGPVPGSAPQRWPPPKTPVRSPSLVPWRRRERQKSEPRKATAAAGMCASWTKVYRGEGRPASPRGAAGARGCGRRERGGCGRRERGGRGLGAPRTPRPRLCPPHRSAGPRTRPGRLPLLASADPGSALVTALLALSWLVSSVPQWQSGVSRARGSIASFSSLVSPRFPGCGVNVLVMLSTIRC